MGKKTIAEWTEEFEKAAGSEFEKSLELFRQYCGFVPSLGGNMVANIFGEAITGRWHSHNSDAVRKAIIFYYPNIKTERPRPERSVVALLENVRIHLNLNALIPKEDGDLNRIIKVIKIKTGAYMRPIKETIESRID